MSDLGEPGSPSEALLRMAYGAEPISDLVARAEEEKKERESEEATAELLDACPLLRDTNFVNSYPDIVLVARYLHSHLKRTDPEILRREGALGAESVQAWLEQVQRKEERAVRDYQAFRKAYT